MGFSPDPPYVSRLVLSADAALNIAQINAAILKASLAGGGEVVLSGGVYPWQPIVHPLTNSRAIGVIHRSNVKVSSDGGTTLQLVPNATLPVGCNPGSQCYAWNNLTYNAADAAHADHDMVIEDVTIDGNAANQPYTSTAADATIDIGTPNVVVSAGNHFTAGMLHQYVNIKGAGPAGGDLVTIVTAFTDTAHMTLRNAASTGVATVTWELWGMLCNGFVWSSAKNVKRTRCTAKNIYGTAGGPPGETFHFDCNGGQDATETDCIVDNDGGAPTASGFSSNNQVGVSRSGCVAHGSRFSNGFTDFGSSIVRNSNCDSYSNHVDGFNADTCEDYRNANCSGGSRAKTSAANPFFTAAQHLGNQNGFSVANTIDFDLTGCVARYNVGNGAQIINSSGNGQLSGGSYDNNGAVDLSVDASCLDIRISPSTRIVTYFVDVPAGTFYPTDVQVGSNNSGSATLASRLIMNGAAAANKEIDWLRNGSFRWLERMESTIEPGGNVGSDLVIQPRDDTGAGLTEVIRYTRLGKITLGAGRSLGLPYKSGAGATISDADFTTPPANGALAVAYDTTTARSSIWERANGVWTALRGNQVDVYNASGAFVWTKPAWATSIDVWVCGGGGGGGSGRKGAAGSVRCGGGGGSGGPLSHAQFSASDLGPTVGVTVGIGGAGGVAQAVNSTDGNNGGGGGVTYFGDAAGTAHLHVLGGNGGSKGTNATGTGSSAASGGMWSGLAGGSADIAGGVGGAGATFSSAGGGAGGGGAGGGITAADAASAGGTGNASNARANNTGNAGGAAGVQGTDAVVFDANSSAPGSGGGGGGGSTAGAAGRGGNGIAGGAGGGGGAGLDAVGNSGAGGAGAPGFVVVISRA